jgi:hypothetical protein
MGLLYGRAGRLTAKNGGFRPGQCGAVSISFDTVGAIASVKKGGAGWSGSLGGFIYQSLSSGNFTDFCMDYGNKACKATTENPGCHNFHKPNMSSAGPQYTVVRPLAKALWVKANLDGGCTYLVEATVPMAVPAAISGAPSTVWTEVTVDAKAAATAEASTNANAMTSITLTSTWINKTTTRMAEASVRALEGV